MPSDVFTREDEALVELTAAKEAYRADKSPGNRARHREAVRVIEEIRQQERGNRPTRVAGDVYITGV